MTGLEIILLSLAGGICADLLLGDPPNRFHPVAWVGHIIEGLTPKLKESNHGIWIFRNQQRAERSRAIIFSLVLVLSFAIVIQISLVGIAHMIGSLAIVVFCVLVLKISIAIRGMQKHAKAVMQSLQGKDLSNARFNLSMIVKRDTENLDEEHIISGTIESIAENIVDGVTSPLFYFSLFGPAGAFSFRIISTLDSMLGYTDSYHKYIGWMPAVLDTVSNYLPARITALMLVIAAKIVNADWKKSIQILCRDSNKTSSRNAGYPMAAMAGALRIELEKIGHYSLGDACEHVSIEKCEVAISIMKCTAIVFYILFSIPLITILHILGWWTMIFGA